MRQANPFHCSGAALDATSAPGTEIDWKGRVAHKGELATSASLRIMYISLQELQKMTCLEADVHVWLRRWSAGFLRTGKIALIALRHIHAARDVLAFG